MSALLASNVPTVAALQGHTFAAGAMLALAHDQRVMRADRGFFCLPEVDIRIPFTPGMTELVMCRLPKLTAHEAMTTGRRYGGADAAACGLVDAAVDELHVLGAALERARPLAAKDPATLGATAGKAANLQTEAIGTTVRAPAAQTGADVPVGDLGSGSDYTVFLQHLGVPSTDVSTNGPFGVYHSAFDNFAWFKKFGDPNFRYEQQMARVFGLEALRLADCDVLPFDYEEYASEISVYVRDSATRADLRFGKGSVRLDDAQKSAARLAKAGAAIMKKQRQLPKDSTRLNRALHNAERAFLLPDGLPGRPWFRHAIYAPGKYTGYAAVVIPGVNEAIDLGDRATAQREAVALAEALTRAAESLESAVR